MKIAAFMLALVALAVAGAWAGSGAATSSTPTSTDDCTPTADGWQRYSWTGGPHASDDPPAFPSEDWQANVAGDPQGIGVEGAYFVSHGNAGLGDWFYLELVAGHDCPPPDTTTDEPPTTTDPCELDEANLYEAECPPPTTTDEEPPVDPPGDVCKNLGGVQTTVPVGYIAGTDLTCFPTPDQAPPADAPPGTQVGDCVVQANRELLCGEQG